MDFDRRMLAAVFLLLILAFAGGVKYHSLHESTGQEDEMTIEDVSAANPTYGMTENQAEKLIQVYVCGEVQNPGIYTLKEGARLHEAVEMAIVLEGAELKYLGMARELVDGETVVVPAPGDIDSTLGSVSPAGTSPSGINSGRVNINQASADEMASKLTGIGPVLAQRITDYRSTNGPFQKIEDLQQVTGIGEKKFNDIKDSICVR